MSNGILNKFVGVKLVVVEFLCKVEMGWKREVGKKGSYVVEVKRERFYVGREKEGLCVTEVRREGEGSCIIEVGREKERLYVMEVVRKKKGFYILENGWEMVFVAEMKREGENGWEREVYN